jgi:hypothetical protein
VPLPDPLVGLDARRLLPQPCVLPHEALGELGNGGRLPVAQTIAGRVLATPDGGEGLEGTRPRLLGGHRAEAAEGQKVEAALGAVGYDEGLPAAGVDPDAKGREVVVSSVVGTAGPAAPDGGLDGALGEVHGHLLPG